MRHIDIMVQPIILFKNMLKICCKKKHLWKRSVNYCYVFKIISFNHLEFIITLFANTVNSWDLSFKSATWQRNVADVVTVNSWDLSFKNASWQRNVADVVTVNSWDLSIKNASWQRNVADVVKVLIYTVVPKNNVKS